MASARKNVSKKVKQPVLEDPKLVRHERLTLVLYLLGGPALIAGMVVLSEFLSRGKPSQLPLIIAGTLFGICAVGFLVVYLMRRASDK
ncbi:MAG: hypothetical protein AABY18_01295 [Candidatus Thermoplasmatota archaeon]